MQSTDSRVPARNSETPLAEGSPPSDKRSAWQEDLGGQGKGTEAPPLTFSAQTQGSSDPGNSPQQPRKPSEDQDRKENIGSWKTSLEINTNLSYFLP